jgi:Asp-tRNA(Asn)/Glu-tRNA(Gln) amidotransferase A subunit family amidase
MSSDLHLWDMPSIRESLQTKSITFEKILASAYKTIDSNEETIKAWESLVPIREQPEPSNDLPLAGLCLGVKDIFATIESPTGMGTDNSTWTGTTGSFDARVVSKLRNNGATIIGKNKTAEFAVHEPTNTLNPRNHDLTPGTSSSGGAAAVAAGHVSISLASQTAGSIARPASYCGVIGFKPSFGELPRTGVLKTTESFDTVGIIGNSITNIRSVFEIARVSDLNHPIHIKQSINSLKNPRILIAIGADFDEANEEIRNLAIQKIADFTRESQQHFLINFSKIKFKDLRACHNVIYAKELSYFLKNEIKSGSVSKGLRDFAEYGDRISIEEYNRMLTLLNMQRKVANLELSNTVIIALSAANEAPTNGKPDVLDSNLFWTALGLPQISLPLLISKNDNPIGLSLVATKGADSSLLDLALNLFPGRTSH